ncbi:outer membrane beta-barrel protein [bacterium SCSIO 12741]|nr:outer membrane beta-barrel protein [bacterium SCSIO 12741]
MKTYGLLILILFGGLSAQAQLSDALDETQKAQRSKGHNKGEIYLMPSVGLGDEMVGSTLVPPLIMNAEFGFHDMLSVGGFVGYGMSQSQKYVGVNANYFWRYSYYYFGARTSFHWGRYLPVPDEVDLYGRFSLGWRIRTEKLHETTSFPGIVETSADFGLLAGLHAGAKYKLNSNFGVFLEVGYERMSAVQLGAAIQF